MSARKLHRLDSRILALACLLVLLAMGGAVHVGVWTIDLEGACRRHRSTTLLGWIGIPAKLPMLALMAGVFLFARRRQIKPYAAALLTMTTFIGFNSVLFLQYFVWAAPFLPLAAGEWLADSSPPRPETAAPTTADDG